MKKLFVCDCVLIDYTVQLFELKTYSDMTVKFNGVMNRKMNSQ